MEIRNIAIIAHVDHGKTTLVDTLLQSSHTFRENEEVQERALDSNDLERERGITILAKNTAIKYNDVKINILDTPGHSDFGGEVERIMKMVDGVVLVVDAYEGTMPQTRFVMKKALEEHLIPIVVINKIDKPSARPEAVYDEVLDLFIDLGADEDQLEFPVCYTSAINNTSSMEEALETQQEGMAPLLDLIISELPSPSQDIEGSLQFQPALLDYSDFVGRIGIGRITRGVIHAGQTLSACRLDGSIKQFRVQKLFTYLGLNRTEVKEAHAGDICAVAGLVDVTVGETFCEVGKEEALEKIEIDAPTVEMTFGSNTSPFIGREGKNVTSSKIEERLFREMEKDVSLRVERLGSKEEWKVAGRGELHLGILIENMRRENFEFQVSRPHVITREVNGVMEEPFEYVVIDAPSEYIGGVIDMMGKRSGILEHMTNTETQSRVTYTIPSRGLIGFNTDFMTLTKGYGIISHSFYEYRKMEQVSVGTRKNGVLICMADGVATAYSAGKLENRGTLFVAPGAQIYEGMIVGESPKEMDLAVNITTAKEKTNTRSANKDFTVTLKKPKVMTLESCLEYINDDELVEITPQNVRLRKRILNTNERKKSDSRNKK